MIVSETSNRCIQRKSFGIKYSRSIDGSAFYPINQWLRFHCHWGSQISHLLWLNFFVVMLNRNLTWPKHMWQYDAVGSMRSNLFRMILAFIPLYLLDLWCLHQSSLSMNRCDLFLWLLSKVRLRISSGNPSQPGFPTTWVCRIWWVKLDFIAIQYQIFKHSFLPRFWTWLNSRLRTLFSISALFRYQHSKE